MGKGSRLKAERAEAAARATAPATVEMLAISSEAVGDVFGTEADCASAAALLKLTAEHLGFILTPRAVSLYAHRPSTNDFAFMGPKATSLIPESKRHRVENHFWDGKDTGHMILTSEVPRALWDPNLRQLGSYGIPAPSLTLSIASTKPTDGGWTAKMDDLELIYLLDGNDALWERYEDGLTRHAKNAEVLAGLVRSGTTAGQIRARQRPRG